MKIKTLSIIVGVILLMGIVMAGTITKVNPLTFNIPNFIAGGTATTTFSFDYPNVDGNYNEAPLVARVNISSLNSNYPVWKRDFNLFMYVEHCLLPFCLGGYVTPIPMTCSEDAPINFKAKDKPDVQYTIDEVLNGTFYCYNPNYYMLDLDSRDQINLELSSDPALYPGNYSVSVELLEMEPDNSPPNITLFLDSSIFGEEDKVHIRLSITDMYPIKTAEYKITNPDLSSYYNSGWIEVQLNESSGFYEDYFDFPAYGLNTSGTYWIFARACDVLGNCREM